MIAAHLIFGSVLGAFVERLSPRSCSHAELG
jgi:hypothetical protein